MISGIKMGELMKTARHRYYQLMVLIFEKYGFEVITSNDYRTIYVCKNPCDSASVPFLDLEKVLMKEELDDYIKDVVPVHVAAWKIVVV